MFLKNLHEQIQKYRKYWILVACLGLIFLGGLVNGVMDTLQFHYSTSIFPQSENETFLWKGRQFWDPKESWKNKYKNWPEDPRPAFPGATTWLVSLTDAWHLLKTIMMLCYHLAIVLPLVYLYKFPRWVLLAAVIPLNLFFGLAFTIMYGYVLVRPG